MNSRSTLLVLAVALGTATGALSQPLVNLGLVGVGRLPADSFDQLGPADDTLGGLFSSLWLDPATLTRDGNTYRAVLYAAPDRGFGNGTTAYLPRLQQLRFAITPASGPGPFPQDQIALANTGTLLFAENGHLFTGFDPDDTNFVSYPRTLDSGLGEGLRSLDPEGVARAADGSWYVCDEYGPLIYHFNPAGTLLETLGVPDAYVPRLGPSFPRVINFLAASIIATNDSGRYNNRGFEGLSITPDGTRLVTVLQSPLVQDGESRNPSRNTRILVYDLQPLSPTFHQPIAEYVHVLPLSAAEANNRHTPVSEILALSNTKFLILQRDSRGRGGDPGPFLYKRVVEVDASAASNILGTGYDLEKGAPGQLSLPRSGLPTNITAVASRDLVDIINPAQLARFGLNVEPTNHNANTISEKWEGLAVLPLNDPAAPNDYLLLVGNDNDFKAGQVFHNGVLVGTNEVVVDVMLLAFRIGEDHTAPTLSGPATLTAAAGANCTLPSILGKITATDNSAAPVSLSQAPASGTVVTLGAPITVTVSGKDAAGNAAAPITLEVTVTDQTPPVLQVPTNLVVSTSPGACSAPVNFTVTATDNCGSPTVRCSPPSGSTFPKGTTTVLCSATDPSGNVAIKSFTVTVQDTEPPAIVSLVPSRSQLWPPNHALVPVTIAVRATDNCEVMETRITGVRSNEPESGPGQQDAPDSVIGGPLLVYLRAERLGGGAGRLYTITVRCTDSSGNIATQDVVVTVPHDRGTQGSNEGGESSGLGEREGTLDSR